MPEDGTTASPSFYSISAAVAEVLRGVKQEAELAETVNYRT